MTARRWLCAIVGLALLLPATPGLARGVQAQMHMDRGIELYDAGDFARAADEFEAAYQLEPDHELLYNWAIAEFLAGSCKTALGLLRRLDLTILPPEFVPFVEESIASCEKKLELEPGTDAGVPEPEPEPDAAVPEPEPDAGVDVDVVVLPAVRGPWYRDVLGDALVLGGVGSLALGVGFYVSARDYYQKALIEAAPDNGGTLPQALAYQQTASNHQLIALVSVAAGTGLIAAGLWRYRNRRATQPAPLTISFTGRDGFIGWGGTF